MSKLFKSKFLLGVMVVAIVLVGAAVTANAQQATVSASDIQFAATVQQGSSGQASLIWQKFFNNYSSANLVADGKFGPLTAAAAKVWQASRNLAVDGVLGTMSRASAVAQINSGVTMPVGGTYPAGCSSFSGYSVTTGMPCSGGVNLPAGCTSTAGFSPTTGQSCSGGSTPSTSGPLTGGAGSLDDVDLISSLSDENVPEGSSDVKIAGWTISADNGSDLAITAFKLSFDQNCACGGSTKLTDYADKVTIWQGSTQIGSADISSFSENSRVYTKTINLSGAVVRADDDSDFFATIDSLSNIDSTDLSTANNIWTLNLTDVRFQDASGAVITDSTTGDIGAIGGTGDVNFSFTSVSDAEGVELKVSATSGSAGDAVNEGHVVDIDATTNTTNVPLLAFDLKATGDITSIQDIPVKIVAGSAGTGDVIDIASGFTLWMDGVQIDSVSASNVVTALGGSTACAVTDETCYAHFNDIDFDMDDGDTAHFLVKADIRDTSATLVNGDTLTVTIGSLERAAIDAEDANGNTLSTEMIGAATAEAIAFYDTGIMVDFVSSSATVSHVGDPNTAGDSDQGTYVIKFDVTAFGADMFIDKDPIEDDDATYSTVTQVSYFFEDGNSTGDDMAAGVATMTSSGDAAGTNSFRVGEGETETFTLTVVGAASTDTFAYVAIGAIGWNDTDNTTAGDTLYAFNLDDFKTGDIYLNDN